VHLNGEVPSGSGYTLEARGRSPSSQRVSKGLVIECKGLVIEVYEAFTGATQAAVNEVVAKIEAAAA
jgi:hypothetical protein